MTTLLPHRRRNPLTGEWILVSPHRAQRPWQGSRESAPPAQRPTHDPECYLCPGNERVGGEVNPDYDGTWWFPNDFPALLDRSGTVHEGTDGVLEAGEVTGECRVLCFSPRHDLTLARADQQVVRDVVDLWADQLEELNARWGHVQVFENRGAAMGASNPHPHGQLWATSVVPTLVTREDSRQAEWFRERGTSLLLDTLAAELAAGDRIVEASEHVVALVPWWAAWPYELLVVPRRPVTRLPDLTDEERDDLAAVLRRVLVRCDNLFETPFPYSFGWHGAPGLAGATVDQDHWQLHAHVFPPLLRSASVRKFMVGFELMAEQQRDITPEMAAERLREVSDVHHAVGALA